MDMLGQTFREVNRLLAPDGGLFLFDFARLRSDKSIHYFSTRHAHLQSDFFTEDYRNSLRAAFYLNDVKRLASEHLDRRGDIFAMWPLGVMFAIKGHVRQTDSDRIRDELQRLRQQLPPFIARDLKDILRLFRLGGLKTALLD